MRCPLCPDSVLIVSHRHGIEVDHCPTCRGVWLDRGELDHLVDSIAERLGPPPPAAPTTGAPPRDSGRSVPPEPVRRPEPDPQPVWRSDDDRGGKRRKRRRHAVLDLLDEVLDL